MPSVRLMLPFASASPRTNLACGMTGPPGARQATTLPAFRGRSNASRTTRRTSVPSSRSTRAMSTVLSPGARGVMTRSPPPYASMARHTELT